MSILAEGDETESHDLAGDQHICRALLAAPQHPYWSEPAIGRRKKHGFRRAPFIIVIYVSIGLDNSKRSVYVIDRPYRSSPWRGRERRNSLMVNLAAWHTVDSACECMPLCRDDVYVFTLPSGTGISQKAISKSDPLYEDHRAFKCVHDIDWIIKNVMWLSIRQLTDKPQISPRKPDEQIRFL
jgi:hypothetical protein